MSSSLSSVVSDLVRASMGSTVPNTVTDEDLDRHIGEIILREAKQKAEQYKRDGFRAYLPVNDANVPRANKRFLSSIIRSTDDHNKAVLRSQAIAVAELKEEREAQARSERRARADEAAQDRLRRLMSGGRRSMVEDRWRPDRDLERGRDGKKRHDDRAHGASRSRSQDEKRYWDEDEEEYQSRIRSSRRRHGNDDAHGDRRHRHRRRHSSSHSSSPRRTNDRVKRCSRSRSPTGTKSSESSNRSHHRRSRSPYGDNDISKRSHSATRIKSSDSGSRHRRRRHHPSSRSRSPRRDTPKVKLTVPTRSPTPARSPPCASIPTPDPPSRTPSPSPIASKMDKYFSPTYDPRLDVAPLASSSSGLTIEVPATGLIDNAQFEGWDAMLELIRLRREDRAEKKRLERMGLGPDKDKDKEGRGKKGKGMVSATAEEGRGIMEIEYKKKGAVREWDMGKEGF